MARARGGAAAYLGRVCEDRAQGEHGTGTATYGERLGTRRNPRFDLQQELVELEREEELVGDGPDLEATMDDGERTGGPPVAESSDALVRRSDRLRRSQSEPKRKTNELFVC